MTDYFADLPPTRFFVPLCGKSLDLKWLLDHGHDVLGVEFSEQACREFFKDHSLRFQESRVGRFTRFYGDRIAILNGDFFDLEPEDLGSIGAIYDRAALIALPPDVRARYAQKMIRLRDGVGGGKGPFKFLQIVLERTPADEIGPPFSVKYSEIQKLYGGRFEIHPLTREKVDLPAAPGTVVEECVYELK